MKNILIKARNLSKIYRLPAEDIYAVNKINLDVNEGDFISIMGPSGSGKTTLLDILGCMDSLSEGQLEVFSIDVSKAKERDLVDIRRGNIGFVFQEFLLVPTLTALENVQMPLYFLRQSIDNNKGKEILEKVGLKHRANHLPKQLSGGEKQRVAIARALIASPRLLIADEPTGNLDTKNSQDVFNVFKKLNEDGLTIIVATHDINFGEQTKSIVKLKDGMIEK